MEEDLSKYFQNIEVANIMRSEIHFSDYNPRKITADGKRALRRSIKKFGVVGGIVVNKNTGNTIVGGHQKVAILDELMGYPEKDYMLRAEIVDMDLKTEKTLNVTLNNLQVGGDWDYDRLAAIVPDIDYKDAGLTEADLSMIGLDYLFRTEKQNDMSNALDDIMSSAREAHDEELRQRAEEREMRKTERQMAEEEAALDEIARQSQNAEAIAREEAERQARIQHMKDVKQEVREKAIENAQNQDAYIVLSFGDFKTKAAFCQRFGYNAMERTIKGEDFDARLEEFYSDSIDEEDYDN